MYYILNPDKSVRRAKDVDEWVEQRGESEYILKQELYGQHEVSTVFLGIDHNFFGGEPILFETMIFPNQDYQTRCSTYEQAIRMHEEALQHLKRNDKKK